MKKHLFAEAKFARATRKRERNDVRPGEKGQKRIERGEERSRSGSTKLAPP